MDMDPPPTPGTLHGMLANTESNCTASSDSKPAIGPDPTVTAPVATPAPLTTPPMAPSATAGRVYMNGEVGAGDEGGSESIRGKSTLTDTDVAIVDVVVVGGGLLVLLLLLSVPTTLLRLIGLVAVVVAVGFTRLKLGEYNVTGVTVASFASVCGIEVHIASPSHVLTISVVDVGVVVDGGDDVVVSGKVLVV